ncbi:MAG: hypothetical protein CL940_12070, partial [Deltaproteobacteria bacterium]|nr:hypothetical protein [Deltaproteobacteria bacterium]
MKHLLERGLLMAFMCFAGSAWAVSFDDRSAELGLVSLFKTTVTPVWIDLDGDGTPEPLWLSHDGWFALDLEAEGGAAVREIDPPDGHEGSDAGDIVSVVLDADGDAVAELMVITDRVELFRVVAPWTLELENKRAVSMPPASVVDAAVGDLNGDGLPDVVAGMALYRGELLPRSGHPDVALMNLGHGRFEVVSITPEIMGLSNGVTLADMDGDGRLDLVESLDFTSMGDLSRILLNRTEAGSPVPVFEVSEHIYDCGTYGMGAAIADVNGDGRLDIYNSSLGRDLMVLAQPDGSWVDVTNELGLTHEWGVSGLRNQWSPIFLDLNADGLLDLFVRQGGMGVGGAVLGADSGPHLAFNERDVLYLGTPDGTFERALPPHHPVVATMGRHGVSGDGDNDGVPDLAHGGDQASAGFWHNQTEIEAEGRGITVRFESTVSAWPPTGARLEASCGDDSLRRSLTSGGLMGATRATEVYLGWPQCEDQVTITVDWPSGVSSSHEVLDQARTVTVTEPRWWLLDPEAPKTVTLDPAITSAEQACVGSPLGQWTCCAPEDAPCTITPPEAVGGAQQVKLAGALPMAVPTGAPRWTVATSPSPPRKGETVEVYVRLQSDPREFDALTSGPSAPTLMHGLNTVPWVKIDETSQTLRTFVDVPSDATSLELTLFPFDLPNSPTWVLPTGSAIDPQWALQDVYPYRITGGVTEFWHIPVYSTLIRDQQPAIAMSFLELSTLDGTPMEFSLSPDTMAASRGRFLVDPLSVLEVDSLVLRDTGGSFEETFEIFPLLTLEEAAPLVDQAPGGLANTRLLEGGEESTFLFSLVDGQGRYMPPEPELITVEVDGGELVVEPSTQMAAYTMGGTIRTTLGVEPGEVRVFSLDGRLLSSFAFERRARGNSGVSAEDSEIEAKLLEGSEAPTGPGEATHQVTVKARHAIGDILGYTAEMDLVISGGAQVTEPVVGPYGAMHFLVAIADEPGEMRLEVSLDGGALEPWIVAHSGHPFPAPSVESPDVLEADARADVAEVGAAAPEPAAPSRDSGGCAGGPAAPSSGLLWALILGLWFVARRGLRRSLAAGGCGVVAVVALTVAPAQAVEFEDQSEALGLVTHFSDNVIPVWIDLDFDGTPEPLWIAHEGWFGVALDDSGAATLKKLDPPIGYVQTDGPDIVSVVLDTDGDHTPELLLITKRVELYRLTAPWTFELVSKRAISMPPASIVDAAVGDLNADGLPDIVAGMALYRGELLSRSGHRDIALMNLGHGRFEAVVIEPASHGISAGVTLADMDGDGRVDFVESQDFTSMGEKSRILLNRTTPGDPVPTFIVDEHTYDCGTYGMGAAVADVNGDGLVDIYNTSLGRDLMVLRQPDGSWLDATTELGVHHEWGVSGLRNQWSPMFLDLNADSRLDLYVRQGGMGTGGAAMGVATGPQLGFNERDLVYLGGEDGRFVRTLPPHHKVVATQGRQVAAGDLDDDGLPDIAHGGQEGSAGFWRNRTTPSPKAQPLTVRFESTVSGWPPTGARVEGRCDGTSVRRSLTSGG